MVAGLPLLSVDAQDRMWRNIMFGFLVVTEPPLGLRSPDAGMASRG
jgi:hypothetical protein